jgi:hypothetical protein
MSINNDAFKFIYESADGRSFFSFGECCLNEQGNPLGLDEFIELLDRLAAEKKSQPTIADDGNTTLSGIPAVRKSTLNQGMFEGFNEKIGDYDQMVDAERATTFLGLSDCSMQSLYRSSHHPNHPCTPFPNPIEFRLKRYWFINDILDWGRTNILYIQRTIDMETVDEILFGYFFHSKSESELNQCRTDYSAITKALREKMFSEELTPFFANCCLEILEEPK